MSVNGTRTAANVAAMTQAQGAEELTDKHAEAVLAAAAGKPLTQAAPRQTQQGLQGLKEMYAAADPCRTGAVDLCDRLMALKKDNPNNAQVNGLGLSRSSIRGFITLSVPAGAGTDAGESLRIRLSTMTGEATFQVPDPADASQTIPQTVDGVALLDSVQNAIDGCSPIPINLLIVGELPASSSAAGQLRLLNAWRRQKADTMNEGAKQASPSEERGRHDWRAALRPASDRPATNAFQRPAGQHAIPEPPNDITS